MEWLTLLKSLQESNNATTIAELQQQVNHIAEATAGMGRCGLAMFACLVVMVIILLIQVIANERKVKRMAKKLEKLIPLIEQAAGVKVV